LSSLAIFEENVEASTSMLVAPSRCPLAYSAGVRTSMTTVPWGSPALLQPASAAVAAIVSPMRDRLDSAILIPSVYPGGYASGLREMQHPGS